MSDNNYETIILPYYRTDIMGWIYYPPHDRYPGKPAEPWLSVSGDWLREAGFKGNQELQIQYGWQKLVITPMGTEK